MKFSTKAVNGFSVSDRYVCSRSSLDSSGASGDIYQVINRRLMRYEVMRVFPRSAAQDENAWFQAQRRFWKDALVGSTLRHPNLIRVYDYDLVDDKLCLTMQHAFYGSVTECSTVWGMWDEGLPPIEWAVSRLEDAARGLEALHSVGVIHRNVKPSNVLVLDDDYRAVIGDFGNAQVNESFFSSCTDYSRPSNEFVEFARSWIDEEITQHPGTPGYMSPEHFKPAPLEPASDVYSLGCVAFEMLTGKRYAEAKTQSSWSLYELPPAVPPWFHRLVKDMLAEDVNKRIKSMTEVLARIVAGCVEEQETQEDKLEDWRWRHKQGEERHAQRAAELGRQLPAELGRKQEAELRGQQEVVRRYLDEAELRARQEAEKRQK